MRLLYLLTMLFFSLSLTAQPAVRVQIPGSAFQRDNGSAPIMIDDVAGGRRFRAKAFAKIILRAKITLPPSTSAAPKMQRLVIHFRTSKEGPSLRTVVVSVGSPIQLNTNAGGDFMTREVISTNAWAFNPPIPVGAGTLIHLTIQFPGGFDSPIDPGEFVLSSVEVDFPRTLAQGSPNLSPTNPIPSTGLNPSNPTAGNPGVIYALSNDNRLLWYRHTGAADGSFRWAFSEGKTVGNGWDFKQLFPGDNGVIYAITNSGDLLWFRHTGIADGSFRWAFDEGKKVGTGWNFKQVFSGGNGIIYAITDNGDLLWYRHDGYNDGSSRWAFDEGKKVGTGWNFKNIFPGDNGVIYVINDNNDLLWYRHDGYNDGSFHRAFNEGKKVGTGWNFKNIFPGDNGVIYVHNALKRQ